ncbi:hypothetical protein F4818DRAFT_406625 [Hypoxylon cercidicola]|nr:hypothetical protein F4818DRAFT_406625 [Hypoxylon cercidicola]
MGRPLWVEPTKKSTSSDASVQSRTSIHRPSSPRRFGRLSVDRRRQQQIRDFREARLRGLAALQGMRGEEDYAWGGSRPSRNEDPLHLHSPLSSHPSSQMLSDLYALEPEIASLMDISDMPPIEGHEDTARALSNRTNALLEAHSLPDFWSDLPPEIRDDLRRRNERDRSGRNFRQEVGDELMRNFTERLALETATVERERAAEERAAAAAAVATPPLEPLIERLRSSGLQLRNVDGLGDRDRSLSPEAGAAWDTLQSTLTPDPQPPSVGSSFARVDEPEPPCDPLNEPDAEAQRPEGLQRPAPPSRPTYAEVLQITDRSPTEMAEDPEWLEGLHHIVRGLASSRDIPDDWWAEAGLTRSMSWEG